MGWGSGETTTKDGTRIEAGYNFVASCDHPECDAVIDRGLYYVCGSMHGGGNLGCGWYFCGEHLNIGFTYPPEMIAYEGARHFESLCEECWAAAAAEYGEPE